MKDVPFLSTEQKRELADHLTRALEWKRQLERLRDMQARHAGRGLLGRLLKVREGDSIRG